MRHVFSNSQLAHVWAHQSQPDGRNTTDCFRFVGRVLWSWQTIVAEIVEDANGRRVALFGRETYSSRTAAQMRDARNAVRGLMPSYTVNSLGYTYGRAGALDAELLAVADRESKAHGGNAMRRYQLAGLVSDYHKHAERLRRMRTDPWSYDGLREIQSEAVLFAEAFGLPQPVLDYARDVETIKAYRAERDARLNTPEAIAKREATKQRREFLARERAERQAREAAAQLEAAAAAWLCGTLHRMPWSYNGPTLLRVKDNRVETSRGADVPISDARRALAYWHCLIRDQALPWTRGDSAHADAMLSLGPHFRVDSIDADGNVRAGCHTLRRTELESLARVLADKRSAAHV